MDEKVEHPLDVQNAIEREIQLVGAKDPDNYKMPDGRTLTQVRNALTEEHEKEYREETKMIGETTRKASTPELIKGKKLVMTKAGSIVDVTAPPMPEVVREELPPPPPPTV